MYGKHMSSPMPMMAKGGMCKHGDMDCEMCHGGMADGGMVDGDDIVSRIMHGKRMSMGGRVANESEPEADFEPNDFDDLVLDDNLDADYKEDGPGDEREDMDRHDIVSRIMKSKRMSAGSLPGTISRYAGR